MVLMSVGNIKGDCVGRCDSRCYNATGPICVCCCGGMNHGKGLQQAIDNTAENAEVLLYEWNDPEETLKIGSLQEELFEEVPV